MPLFEPTKGIFSGDRRLLIDKSDVVFVSQVLDGNTTLITSVEIVFRSGTVVRVKLAPNSYGTFLDELKAP